MIDHRWLGTAGVAPTPPLDESRFAAPACSPRRPGQSVPERVTDHRKGRE